MRYDRLTVFHDRLKCPGASLGGGRVHTDGIYQQLDMLAPLFKHQGRRVVLDRAVRAVFGIGPPPVMFGASVPPVLLVFVT